MNTIVVSRRVQWALLISLVLSLILFAPLLIAVGIALTVAITVHPFYTGLYSYFRISERSGKTETFFAMAITLLISFGVMMLLALPVWIIVENREDIIRGGREILVQIEQFDLGALFAGGEAEQEDGEDADGEGPGDEDGNDIDDDRARPTDEPGATAGTGDADDDVDDPPPGDSARDPNDTGEDNDDDTAHIANGNGGTSAGPVAAMGPLEPTETAEQDPPREAEPLITPEQIKQAVTGLVTTLLGAIPMLMLSFFVFASVLYLALRNGASLWRRLLNALEMQTSKLLQQLAGSAYRTLYAIYVVHFTTVVITFFLAAPLFYFLGEPYSENMLLWALITALFQLIPFVGPSMIVFGLVGYEFFRPDNPDMVGNILILIFYGYLFVAIFPDWIIRPMLMGRTTGQHSLVMWLGFFGGIAVMGPAGFVFGPLILALLNDGINIVLQHYPDPMKRARRPGWDDLSPAGEARQPFGEIGGQTSGHVFLSAGATAEEDAAIRESHRPRASKHPSQGSLPVPRDEGAGRYEKPPDPPPAPPTELDETGTDDQDKPS